jgi:hypothetical protein
MVAHLNEIECLNNPKRTNVHCVSLSDVIYIHGLSLIEAIAECRNQRQRSFSKMDAAKRSAYLENFDLKVTKFESARLRMVCYCSPRSRMQRNGSHTAGQFQIDVYGKGKSPATSDADA